MFASPASLRSSQSSIHLMNLLSKSARAQKAKRETRFKMPARPKFSFMDFFSIRQRLKRKLSSTFGREWSFFGSLFVFFLSRLNTNKRQFRWCRRFSSVRVWRILRLFRQTAKRPLLMGPRELSAENSLTSIMRITGEFRFVEHCSCARTSKIEPEKTSLARSPNRMEPNWIVRERLFNLSSSFAFLWKLLF